MAVVKDIDQVRVLLIDPGQKPEFVYENLTEEDKVYDDYDEFIGYDTYNIARRLLHRFKGSEDCFIERTCDPDLKGLGIYVDEDGRCKGIQANRNIITQNHMFMPLAGRILVISDRYDDGYVVYNDTLDDEYDQEVIDRLFDRFIRTNGDDGKGPISSLSQEESDKVTYYHMEFSGTDSESGEDDDASTTILDILRSIYGDDVFE